MACVSLPDERNDDDVEFYADVKPTLAVFQALITFPNTSQKTVFKLNVDSNILSISAADGAIETTDRTCHFKLSSVDLSPLTCQGFQTTSDHTLHVRLRLADASERSCLLENTLVDDLNEINVETLKSIPVYLCCRMCGNVVFTREIEEHRVLPLPSDGWLDGSESWWCHGADSQCHSSSAESTTPVSELPMRPHDCLVADSFVVVQLCSLADESYSVSVDGKVICERCHCELGRQTSRDKLTVDGDKTKPGPSTVVKLSTYALRLSQTSSLANWTFHAEDLEVQIAKLLERERRNFNHFRFVFEMRCDQKVIPVVVVWVMDVETLIFKGRGKLLCHNQTDVLPHILRPISVIRLLYKDCLRAANKGIGQTWYKDDTVSTMEMPEFFCLQLLRLLIDSTLSLPSTLRHAADNFSVGFLRKTVSHDSVN